MNVADIPEAAEGIEPAPHELRIGQWILDPERNELRRKGEAAKLEPKATEVLLHLARRPGRVVSREQLLAAVWPGVVVGDDALTQSIIKLRKALGDQAHEPRYIETISKRGYRLVAPVQDATAAAPVPGGPGEQRVRPRRRALVAATLAVLAVAIAIPAVLKQVPFPWPIGTDTRGASGLSLPLVAVLPLTNLSGDSRRDYLSDGITEDIIDALGRFSGLRVMSRNAVQGFKNKSPAAQDIRDLGARYFIKGSVRESDGTMRVAVELSDAQRGVLLWSDRVDAQGAQVLAIQDRIARDVAGALAVRLTRIEEQRVSTRPTESLEAHDLVLRARALLRRPERSANREARALLGAAEKLAPGYADVFVSQCRAEFQRAMYGWIEDITEATQRAETLCKRALALPDARSHTHAHAALSSIYSNQNRRDEALQQAERAIALNPSDSVALYQIGGTMLYLGRIDEAISVMETARRFEPLSAGGENLAVAYYVAGRYAEALAQVETMLNYLRDKPGLYAVRAATLAQLGRLEDARHAAEQVQRLSPNFRTEYFGNRFANPEHMAKLQAGARKAGL